MILLVDNYDSFTYNLYQQIESLGEKVMVIKNDTKFSEIEKINPKKIIISPGPGRPENSGISKKVIQKFLNKMPILGVCLGHQLIAQIFNSKIIHAKKILHGKTSQIFHTENSLFTNVKNPFTAARYHSLIINKIPKNFTQTCWTEDKEIMGIKHNKFPLFGVQFHPESFLTDEGNKIMHNFLYEI